MKWPQIYGWFTHYLYEKNVSKISLNSGQVISFIFKLLNTFLSVTWRNKWSQTLVEHETPNKKTTRSVENTPKTCLELIRGVFYSYCKIGIVSKFRLVK